MVFLIIYIYINRYFLRNTKYSPKLQPKINSQSEFPKLRYRNIIEAYFMYSKIYNYSRKLFRKLLPDICFPEQLSTTPKLDLNIIPKNTPKINAPKLSKIITKNYYPKFLVNTYPKISFFLNK